MLLSFLSLTVLLLTSAPSSSREVHEGFRASEKWRSGMGCLPLFIFPHVSVSPLRPVTPRISQPKTRLPGRPVQGSQPELLGRSGDGVHGVEDGHPTYQGLKEGLLP